jgi:hypothetical protein
MRRRSELCRFRFEDIIELPGKRYGIVLRFSKTDQNGKGKTLPLTQEIFDLLMNLSGDSTQIPAKVKIIPKNTRFTRKIAIGKQFVNAV